MLAAVSRSPENAVIDDIPEPGPPPAGRTVVRPETAGILGADPRHYSGYTAHCRVPGIIAREFRVMSSPPSPQGLARAIGARARNPPSRECRAEGCENVLASPRARRPAPATRRRMHRVRRADAGRGARAAPGRAAAAGEQAAISETTGGAET